MAKLKKIQATCVCYDYIWAYQLTRLSHSGLVCAWDLVTLLNQSQFSLMYSINPPFVLLEAALNEATILQVEVLAHTKITQNYLREAWSNFYFLLTPQAD